MLCWQRRRALSSGSAAWGFGLAASCGVLLFAARTTEYVASPFFLAKMALRMVAGVNALLLARLVARHPLRSQDATQAPSTRLRLAAGLSLLAWVCVLVLGRLVGYF